VLEQQQQQQGQEQQVIAIAPTCMHSLQRVCFNAAVHQLHISSLPCCTTTHLSPCVGHTLSTLTQLRCCFAVLASSCLAAAPLSARWGVGGSRATSVPGQARCVS
jgi:hypothetical protein